MDLLDILQLILHLTAITTLSIFTPGHDGSIAKNGSKSDIMGLDLLHILQLFSHSTAVTTEYQHRPHVTTEPSPRMAAKACSPAWICCTFFS